MRLQHIAIGSKITSSDWSETIMLVWKELTTDTHPTTRPPQGCMETGLFIEVVLILKNKDKTMVKAL